MPRKFRQSKVSREQREVWLRRYQAGESTAKIAKDSGVDPRTVRKHITAAMEESELREARLLALRSALEQHFMDLVAFAKDLDSEIKGDNRISSHLKENRMWSALKQHLPRSPLWPSLNKRERLLDEMTELQSSLKNRLKASVKAAARLKDLPLADREEIATGIAEALVFQTWWLARGTSPLTLDKHLILETTGQGSQKVIRYGATLIGQDDEERFAIVKQILKDEESRITTWDEYTSLKKYLEELKRLNQNLNDELAVIILRRVVPGRCLYCPI